MRKVLPQNFDYDYYNIVIDGTCSSYRTTTEMINQLRQRGYVVYMIMVKTTLEKARAQNRSRARHVVPVALQKSFAVYDHIEKYKKDVDKFVLVDNTGASSSSDVNDDIMEARAMFFNK